MFVWGGGGHRSLCGIAAVMSDILLVCGKTNGGGGGGGVLLISLSSGGVSHRRRAVACFFYYIFSWGMCLQLFFFAFELILAVCTWYIPICFLL